MQRKSLDPRLVAVTAVMATVVFVLTRVVQFPTPARGYNHLGDAGVFFASFAFGPWVGAVAGGLGTALADITSGYAQWAIPSLLIHGLQGWIAGALVRGRPDLVRIVLAIAAGSVVVVVGYFFAGIIIEGVALASAEILGNTVQVLIGGLIGAPLFLAVLRAYPPLAQR